MRTLKTYREEPYCIYNVSPTRRKCEIRHTDIVYRIPKTIKIMWFILSDSGKKCDIDKNSALHLPLISKECVEMLLFLGADINTKNRKHRTPLLSLICNMYYNIEFIDFLLSRGADTNTRCKCGNTPLRIATINCYTDIMELLLAYGAQIDIKNNSVHTLLYDAIDTGNVSVVKILLKYGAVICDGQLLLHAAVSSRRIEMVEFVLSHGINVHERTSDGCTALHSAIKENPITVDINWLMIASGIDVNAKNNKGIAALNYLDGDNYCMDCIKLMLDHGADINGKNEFGDTLLHRAVRNEHKDVAKYLVFRGADRIAKNNRGETPYSIASYDMHVAMSDYL